MKKLKFSPLIFSILALISISSHADFQTPSENIVCSTRAEVNENGGVTCLIRDINSKPIISRPKDCDGDWGNMFYVSATGKTKLACYSDHPFDQYPLTLNYGDTIKGKTYQCTSQKTGMTCMNKELHGFTLSKDSQNIF